MRTIKPYFKGARFYNAFLRRYPVQAVLQSARLSIAVLLNQGDRFQVRRDSRTIGMVSGMAYLRFAD